MKCKLNWTSAQWKSHVSCNKQTGPLKSVLKRKLQIRAEMQRGLERSLGANWGSKWCKCGRQKVRRLKTCNPSCETKSLPQEVAKVEKQNSLKRSWLNNTLEISNGFDLMVLQITFTQECDKSLSKLQPRWKQCKMEKNTCELLLAGGQ